MSGRRDTRVQIDLRGLSAKKEMVRVSQSSAHDPAVEAWLSGEPTEFRSIARPWFLHMRQCGKDVRELIHDGCRGACVETAPFGYVNAFKSHSSVGFFTRAALW